MSSVNLKMMKCVIGGGAALLAVGLGAGRPAHALEFTAQWQKPNKDFGKFGSFLLPQGVWQQRAVVRASDGTPSVECPLHKYDRANPKSSHWRNLGTYLQTSPEKKYEKEEWSQKVAAVENWLFQKGYVQADDGTYLQSKLESRNQQAQAPKDWFRNQFAGSSSLVQVVRGSITGFKAQAGESAAVLDSNNGDLFTGCGFAVAKAVVNAAGPGLQAELYSRFGIPGYMGTPQYGRSFYSKTEGRGYSVTCGGHDMRRSHGIDAIELATAPMKSPEGLVNMFFEAFENSAKRDYLAVPLAGASHSVVKDQQNPVEFHVRVIMEAYRKFRRGNPTSQLKVLFVIYDAKTKQEFQQFLQQYKTRPGWYSYFQPVQKPQQVSVPAQPQAYFPAQSQSDGVPQPGLVGNPYIKPNTQYPQTVTNYNSQNQYYYQAVQFAYESQNKFSDSTKALVAYVLKTRSKVNFPPVSVCGSRSGIWQASGSSWMCIQKNTCTQAVVGQWCDVQGYWVRVDSNGNAGSASESRSVRIQIGNVRTQYEDFLINVQQL